MRIKNRKYNMNDNVVICNSFDKESNGSIGKVLGFVNVNGHFYYDLKLEDGKYILGVLEDELKLADKRQILRGEYYEY